MLGKTLTEKFEKLKQKARESAQELDELADDALALGEDIHQKRTRLANELKEKQLLMLARFRRRQKTLSSEWDDIQTKTKAKWNDFLDKYEIDELEAMLDRFKEDNEALERLPEDAVIRELPPRHHFNMTLENVFLKRRTIRDFTGEPLPEEEVAAILWATDGINRKSLKKTTPSALNWQEVSIYVVQANGIWRYLPKRNVLLFIEGNDQRKHFGEVKPWAKLASQHLVFVSDKAKTETFSTKIVEKAFDLEEKKEQLTTVARSINVGAKVQAVYMAATALGRGCTCRILMDDTQARSLLKLTEQQEILAVCSIGEVSESFFDHVL